MSNEYSVCQFFPNGEYEYVRRFVSAEEAFKAVRHYTTCVAAQHGMIERVIVTDGGDCINFQWEHGKGVTYPTEEDIKNIQSEK